MKIHNSLGINSPNVEGHFGKKSANERNSHLDTNQKGQGIESKTLNSVAGEYEAFDPTLIEEGKYKDLFSENGHNFSEMSINELYDLVKKFNELDREYSQEFSDKEEVRYGKSGNQIISEQRSDMLDLMITLEILSYGEGDVDPNEKINLVEYFNERSDKLEKSAVAHPERDTYQTRSAHSMKLIDIFEKFTSDESLNTYKEKAFSLLKAQKKVDITI